MRKLLLVVWIVSLLVVALPTNAQTESSTYSVVNLSSVESLDIELNGDIAFLDIATNERSPERLINSGAQNFRIQVAGTDALLAEADYEFANGDLVLLIITGTENALEILRYDFDLTPVIAHRANLTVVNIGDAPLTFAAQNGDTLIQDAPIGEFTSQQIPGGVYQVNVQADGIQRYQTTLNAGAGTLITYIAYGETDFITYTLELEQDGYFRFVHAGRITGMIDVYFNDQLQFANLNYRDVTDYIQFPTGAYTVAIYPSGDTATPLWQGDVTINTTPLTAVAFGETNFRMITYADDHLQMAADTARIRFIHTGLNVLLLTVRDGSSEPFVGGLEYALATRNQIIAPGTVDFTFRETDGDDYFVESIDIEANHTYTIILVGNALLDDELQTLILDWTWQTPPSAP